MSNIDLKKLGDYVKIRTGKLDANASSEDGEYPFFTCSIEPLKISSYSYDCECCLVAGNGDLNVKYYNGKFDAYQRTYIIESLDKKKLDVMYLYFFLSSYIEVLRKQSIGGVIKYIKLGNLTDALIPIPSLEKQKKICRNLIKAQKLLTANRKVLSKYDTLIKSRFIEMFGDLVKNTKNWKIKNFTECAEIDTNMVKDFEKYADYPHIGIDSIEKETGILSGYRTVKEDNVISGKYHFTPAHIIYSKIRPNLNKVAMPNFEGLCSADAYPILVKKNIATREYLTYVMRSDFFVSYILAFSRRANMPKVNKEQVESFDLPVPPLSLQNDFASFVQQIDKSKFAVQKSLEKAETLYKSLMQEYFG